MTEKKGNGSVIVSLHDVVEEMDILNDGWTAYLNRRTGEFVTVTDEDRRLVEAGEDSEDLPEWQRETLAKVREALESDDCLALPGKFEIHEYRIMEHFSLGVEGAGVRETLLQAIRGRGAFRRFDEVIHEHRFAESWYTYRQQALEDIAVDWLEANGIAYSREKRPLSLEEP
ncbi:MAG TPA: UPF0158 family protein [Patescibacteria group bacterium]|nr:UPF0158 family protein [Patescibacteria group bacterium]